MKRTGPYFAGGQALLAVEAKYYAGGALPNADVTWEVTTTPGTLCAAQLAGFCLWRLASLVVGFLPLWISPSRMARPKSETFTGKTDASGTHFLRLDFNQKASRIKTRSR